MGAARIPPTIGADQELGCLYRPVQRHQRVKNRNRSLGRFDVVGIVHWRTDQRYGRVVCRQSVKRRAVPRGECLELVQRMFLLEYLGENRQGVRGGETSGASAGQQLVRVRVRG